MSYRVQSLPNRLAIRHHFLYTNDCSTESLRAVVVLKTRSQLSKSSLRLAPFLTNFLTRPYVSVVSHEHHRQAHIARVNGTWRHLFFFFFESDVFLNK